MLVLAVNVLDDSDPDREGEVALFAGRWIRSQPNANECDGDLVLFLSESEDSQDERVDVEMFLAHGNRWRRVGEWPALDADWPWTVAHTAHALVALHSEAP
ncbi:hypothetical protein ACFQ1S_06900 [Kibdelosporangium lantanae]|uniref:Uncharacterized protein n=1 Tax=Kibdelosporangium lantanae TaxID=1497396 RepID=A0ABW3M3Y0_9PSEU